MDEEVEGFRVVAQALSKLGVKYMFGVVGIPVIEVKLCLGIHTRNILVKLQYVLSGGGGSAAGGY